MSDLRAQLNERTQAYDRLKSQGRGNAELLEKQSKELKQMEDLRVQLHDAREVSKTSSCIVVEALTFIFIFFFFESKQGAPGYQAVFGQQEPAAYRGQPGASGASRAQQEPAGSRCPAHSHPRRHA